jgi:hypothetical protein
VTTAKRGEDNFRIADHSSSSAERADDYARRNDSQCFFLVGLGLRVLMYS